MRYYFDDPIQALWMFQTFKANFYFQTRDGDVEFNPQEYADNVDSWIDGYNGRTKIYVAPESEHIFEPENNDVGFLIQTGMTKIYNYLGCKWLNNWLKEGDKPQIIMRDNKHFFNPKIEE